MLSLSGKDGSSHRWNLESPIDMRSATQFFLNQETRRPDRRLAAKWANWVASVNDPLHKEIAPFVEWHKFDLNRKTARGSLGLVDSLLQFSDCGHHFLEKWDCAEDHAGHGFVVTFEDFRHSIVRTESKAAGDSRSPSQNLVC